MPPHKKRSEHIFILDASADFTFIRTVLDRLMVYKSLRYSNDNIKIILNNCPDTKSFTLLEDEGRAMTNNVIIQSLNKHLDRQKESESAAGETLSDWVRAVNFGVSLFEEISADTYVLTFFLVLVSDFTNLKQSFPAEWQECAAKIIELDITLVAVIPEDLTYTVSKPIVCFKEVQEAMESVNDQVQAAGEGVQIIYQLVKEVKGVLTGPTHFLNFMAFLEVPATKQDWQIPLTLGDYYFKTRTRKIVDQGRSMLMRNIPPKKYTYYKCESNFENVDVITDCHETVSEDEVVNVRLFHGEPVYVPPYVVKSFKAQAEPMFKILGFIHEDELPELYFGGTDTLGVFADETSNRAPHFHQFVRLLRDTHKYAIAVRVYSARSSGRLFVLLPQPKPWLLMAALCESVRHLVYPSSTDDDDVDEEALDPGMATLRRHLLKQKPLFHPRGDLGIHRLAIVDNVRRLFGYNVDCYQPTNLFFDLPVPDEATRTVLDTLFAGEENTSEANAGESDQAGTLSEMDGEEDDW